MVDRLSATPGILGLVDDIHELEKLYKEYYNKNYDAAPNVVPPLTSEILVLGVTNFLRSQKYNSLNWTITTGRGIDQ